MAVILVNLHEGKGGGEEGGSGIKAISCHCHIPLHKETVGTLFCMGKNVWVE